jgi:transcriptional regulator with XRE-family HTH domain
MLMVWRCSIKACYSRAVPRTHPMPAEEKAICRRLRQFRLFTGLSQAEFASLAGLDQRAYASYEYARSQLNYPAAWGILRAFRQLSPQWLAEGQGTMLDTYFVSYPMPAETGLGPRALYSLVYEMSLRALLFQSRSAWNVAPDKPFPLFRVGGGIVSRLEGRQIFLDILTGWLAGRPDARINDFLNDLLDQCSQVLDRHPRDEDEMAIKRRVQEMLAAEAKMALGLGKYSQNQGLTNVSESVKVPPVKSQLPSLVDRLKRATEQRGTKSALAKYLGVPLASVSQWLSGEREPGGETTLRLLHWVQQAEAQQNQNPGSAPARPGQKTRVRKSGYEKQTQVHKKK